jgi:hypothetical protein
MLSSNAAISLSSPEGTLLLNVPLFPTGYKSALERIPEERGVYAFFPFRKYSEDPEKLFEEIIYDIERKKFADRSSSLAPYYKMTLSSQTSISTAKEPKLKKALHNKSFRNDILDVLGNSLLFQSPLYLGKAKNLKSRINQHFDINSPLRNRLDEAGYDIEKTTVIIIPTINSRDADQESLAAGDYEALTEEVLSRIFQIHFTIRVG